MIAFSLSFKRTLTAVGILLAAMVLLNYLNISEEIKPNKSFSSFPMHINTWAGEMERFDEEIYELLGVDDSILGNYRNAQGEFVNLYVGFYQSQREGDLIHSPKNCMPGSGWNITNTALEQIHVPETKYGRIQAIKLILEKGTEKQVVLYWFQSRGRIISSEYMQKIYLVVDSVIRRRTDGSFVRLIAPVFDGNEERAVNALKTFARELVPLLMEYIPS